MKIHYLSLLTAGLWLSACESRRAADTGQTPASAATSAAETPVSAAVPLSPRLQALGLTTGHDWQQVSLGDDFADMKANAKTKPFEQDVQHVGYSTEFTNLESVDTQYFQENGKITKIQVDFYLNNPPSVRAYKQELTQYLTARYGAVGTLAGQPGWQQGKVTLRDVSKGKDYGLRLVISH